MMNLKETIKKILREESKLPISISRRIKLGDFLNDMKMNSLRKYEKGGSLNSAIDGGAKFTAAEAIPWHDDLGRDYDNETWRNWVQTLKSYLIKNYGEETLNYLAKILPNDVFNGDGNKYVLIKHSEPNGGGRGFSETYKTWGDLLMGKGWWFSLNWWEIKDKLDKMDSGTILILKPGEKENGFGYYFSIRKIPQ
jgi:hypothetical protein